MLDNVLDLRDVTSTRREPGRKSEAGLQDADGRGFSQRPSKTEDITKTAHYKAAMDDVKNGRIYHACSVDDMFNQILD